jgi:hypothetical protein
MQIRAVESACPYRGMDDQDSMPNGLFVSLCGLPLLDVTMSVASIDKTVAYLGSLQTARGCGDLWMGCDT